MGRSQVQYNQRHGRPGERGRGGGGRTTGRTTGRNVKHQAANTSKQKVAGANHEYGSSSAPGYEDEGSDGNHMINNNHNHHQSNEHHSLYLDEQVMALEALGNYSNKISSTLGQVEETYENHNAEHETAFVRTLDMMKIKNALSKVPLCEILRLPPHLTELLENPKLTEQRQVSQQGMDVLENSMMSNATATSSGGPMPLNKMSGPPMEYEEIFTKGLSFQEQTHPEHNSHTEKQHDDGEEDDMESWLDSVIS